MATHIQISPGNIKSVLIRRIAAIGEKMLLDEIEEVCNYTFPEEAVMSFPILDDTTKLRELFESNVSIKYKDGEARIVIIEDFSNGFTRELVNALESGTLSVPAFAFLRKTRKRMRDYLRSLG